MLSIVWDLSKCYICSRKWCLHLNELKENRASKDCIQVKGRQTQRNNLGVEQGKEQERVQYKWDTSGQIWWKKKNSHWWWVEKETMLEQETEKKVKEKWEASSRSRWEHRKTEIIWASRVCKNLCTCVIMHSLNIDLFSIFIEWNCFIKIYVLYLFVACFWKWQDFPVKILRGKFHI